MGDGRNSGQSHVLVCFWGIYWGALGAYWVLIFPSIFLLPLRDHCFSHASRRTLFSSFGLGSQHGGGQLRYEGGMEMNEWY